MAWGRVELGGRRVELGGALAGLAAGAALAWFLDPVRGGGRRSSAIDRTRRVARGAAQRVPELAGGGALEGVAWPRGVEAVAVAVGSAAAARSLLGDRLLGIPALVAGAALARGAVRGVVARGAPAGGSGAPTRAHRRAQRAASREERRGREERRERAAHAGAWHPEPEVVEVKSPAELEPGIAHATPAPTFADRVSRRSDPPAGARAPRREPLPPAEDASRLEPLPRAGFVAPPEGSAVHAGDLGATPSPEDALLEREGGGGPGEE